MTQILLTLEDSSWLGKVMSALSSMQGVKAKVITSSPQEADEIALQALCGAWKGSQTTEETMNCIESARTTSSFCPEI